jgi:plastocyanin
VISKLYRSLALPLALGALSLAVGCGEKEEQTNPPSGQARSLEITAEEHKFTPSTITASPGERLTITLKNNGKMAHSIEFDFPSDDQELEREITAGQTGHLTFSAPSKVGQYKFYCTVDDHRQKGEEGYLEVHTTKTR